MILRRFHVYLLWFFVKSSAFHVCFCFPQVLFQPVTSGGILLHKRSLLTRYVSNTIIEKNELDMAKEVINSFLDFADGSKNDNCDHISDLIEFVDTTLCKPILGSKNLDSSHIRRLAYIDDKQYHFIWNDNISIQPCPLDPRHINAGIMYHLSPGNHLSDEKSMVGQGILLLEIVENKIISVFDVKKSVNPIQSIDHIFRMNHAIISERAPDQSNNGSGDLGIMKNLLHTLHGNNRVVDFFEARNNRDMERMQNLIDENASLGGFHKEDYMRILGDLPVGTKMEIEDMILSKAQHEKDFDQVFVKWYMVRNGVKLKFSRGCSFYRVQNGLITYGVDILESEKKELKTELKASDQILNHLRDSGLGRFVADSLVLFGIPSIAKNNMPSIQTFFKLTKMKINLRYGTHPSQSVDLFVPKNPKGLVFFVHGGAWGSGMPWMYRLVADPLLNLDLAVAIVGYRTYPDGSVQDQVDDLEAALRTISIKFPHLTQGTSDETGSEWQGISLIGHSSGAHISMLMITLRLVNSVTKQIESNSTHFDKVISLSGVFSISDHYQYESGRGVAELSPMKPACGTTLDNFNFYSPSLRLSSVPRNSFEHINIPKLFLLHGVDDDTVPFTSSRKAAKLMKAWGLSSIDDIYLHEVDHTSLLFDLMFGGKSKQKLIDCLRQR